MRCRPGSSRAEQRSPPAGPTPSRPTTTGRGRIAAVIDEFAPLLVGDWAVGDPVSGEEDAMTRPLGIEGETAADGASFNNPLAANVPAEGFDGEQGAGGNSP